MLRRPWPVYAFLMSTSHTYTYTHTHTHMRTHTYTRIHTHCKQAAALHADATHIAASSSTNTHTASTAVERGAGSNDNMLRLFAVSRLINVLVTVRGYKTVVRVMQVWGVPALLLRFRCCCCCSAFSCH